MIIISLILFHRKDLLHADPIYLAHIGLEVWSYSYTYVRKNFHIFKKWQQKVSSAELSLAIPGFVVLLLV